MEFFDSLMLFFSNLGYWGYLITFLAAFLESMVFLGVIIPGAVLVVLAGAILPQGYFSLTVLIFIVTLGAILGDSLSYYLGTKGTKFFRNENKLLKKEHLVQGKLFFEKYGSKSIAFSRFVGPLRAIVPFIAGLSGMNKAIFFFWNISSAILWALIHVLLGYFFGSNLSIIKIFINNTTYIFGLLIFIFILIHIFKIYYKRKNLL